MTREAELRLFVKLFVTQCAECGGTKVLDAYDQYVAWAMRIGLATVELGEFLVIFHRALSSMGIDNTLRPLPDDFAVAYIHVQLVRREVVVWSDERFFSHRN